jgi:hypothetical protein
MILISWQADSLTLPGQRNIIIQHGSDLAIPFFLGCNIEQNSYKWRENDDCDRLVTGRAGLDRL